MHLTRGCTVGPIECSVIGFDTGGGVGAESTSASTVCDAVTLLLLMLYHWNSQCTRKSEDGAEEIDVHIAVDALLPLAASLAPHPQVRSAFQCNCPSISQQI